MFDNSNPYALRTETKQGITRYFVSFVDGQAVVQETEVSRSVYLEFLSFIKAERNLRRWDERHVEQSELRDEIIYNRTSDHPESIEDTILNSQRNEQFRLTIESLPEIQRRRFLLHHEFGLTYEQIAQMEGRSKMSVCESVLRAEEKIQEKIKNFKN